MCDRGTSSGCFFTRKVSTELNRVLTVPYVRIDYQSVRNRTRLQPETDHVFKLTVLLFANLCGSCWCLCEFCPVNCSLRWVLFIFTEKITDKPYQLTWGVGFSTVKNSGHSTRIIRPKKRRFNELKLYYE